jgi:hypothetical protein
LQAYNPFHGWQPILWSNTTGIEQLFEPREIITPAGPLEQIANEDDQVVYNLTTDRKMLLISALDSPTDVRCLLNKSELLEIVSHIRNEVLRWSMELERAGIIGEGLTFSKHEKEKAQSIEFCFHGVQNVSNVVGDVAEGGRVTVNQQASQGIDPKILADLAGQLRQNIDALVPAADRRRFACEIEVVEAESGVPTPDVGKLKRALIAAREMIRDAGKSAATSLITQGALVLIEGALKHL